MNYFELVQESFRHLHLKCTYCHEELHTDGIEFLGSQEDYCVVRVGCLSCNEAIGIAIVCVDDANSLDTPEVPVSDLTQSDEQKFAKVPPISVDEVIDAHHFFSQLDSTWIRYLPVSALK